MVPAGIYQHYKGGYYQVLGIAADATNEGSVEEPTGNDPLVVVYISLTGIDLPGPRMRVRRQEEFNAQVRWPDGSYKPRFIYVGDYLKR